MTPEELSSLRTIATALPHGTSVPVPKEWVLDLLDAAGPGALVEGSEAPRQADYTVPQVAARFGRAPSTVRMWILERHLRAYKNRGREYRITPQALAEFEANQRATGNHDCGARVRRQILGKPVDLDAYRNAS